ncbi:uncharacterized protein BX664DRAFT_298014 [Halteromyces radiatus]|uniref:uncharacterized protein n=1 Tax=Halteromyces radiatus TaxID=101107 RepID=UPI00221F920C|nr:uncharacterized protein BX664DRAFT_298014 [Halteromyces radiatus]KAI8089934.1 hypothetical protein BX664DRAFT_298014 [Halteromyces radiatus]
MDTQFSQQEDNYNWVDSDTVTLNGFSFCARHGLELCHKCPTDNRMMNNTSIEDLLTEKVSEEELEKKWKGDDREPFTVTNQWVRVGSGKPGCIAHKEVACPECFNWGEKILSEIQGKKKVKRAARKAKDKSSRLE